ncbi:hypothetical protein KO361_03730 [Candidatus Woesearchaeota archaeon]|nr:hypothetical protein [Candidatus Woesearchaeota archaeon]
MEFLILVGFALIMIGALVVVFHNNIVSMEKVREDVLMNQVFNIVFSEFEFARLAMPVYNRTFYLPSGIDGNVYNISIYDDVEVVINYKGREYVKFLSDDVVIVGDSFLVPGPNYLVKECVDCALLLN